jgi:NAD(P)-dependent dehydrogenase (short-subunit alcohol dehydrogenase family)
MFWLPAVPVVSRPDLAFDQNEATWDGVVDTNLEGVWLVAQTAARRMIENKATEDHSGLKLRDKSHSVDQN